MLIILVKLTDTVGLRWVKFWKKRAVSTTEEVMSTCSSCLRGNPTRTHPSTLFLCDTFFRFQHPDIPSLFYLLYKGMTSFDPLWSFFSRSVWQSDGPSVFSTDKKAVCCGPLAAHRSEGLFYWDCSLCRQAHLVKVRGSVFLSCCVCIHVRVYVKIQNVAG